MSPGAPLPTGLPSIRTTGVTKVVASFDPTSWMVGLAAALTAYGFLRGRSRPTWGLPLQAVAMVVTGAVAWWATRVDVGYAAWLVVVALVAHAAWDLHHLRVQRVVVRSMAQFCLVLDLVAAALVAGAAVV